MNTAPILHGLLRYLPPTMGYLHDQFQALGLERTVVCAVRPWEPTRFPLDRLYLAPCTGRWRALSGTGCPLSPHLHRLWRPVVRQEGVKLLHVHDGRLAPRFLPLAREFGLPLVTTFFGYDLSSALADPAYREALAPLLEQGDRFIVMSEAMSRQLQRLGGPADKIRVIPHGVLLSRFPFATRRAPRDGPVVLLTVGRLLPTKGPEELAHAFARLCRHHPNLQLRVVGEGPLRPRMEAILEAAGVRDRAVFRGILEPEAVAAEMACAHVFSLPCREGPDGGVEGIPNVLKEAMASGLPVVSTFHAGIPELVEDEVSGLLAPEGDVDALVERLDLLLREPERWEAMGRAGRARIEAEYDLSLIVRRLDTEVYQPLLDATAPPALVDPPVGVSTPSEPSPSSAAEPGSRPALPQRRCLNVAHLLPRLEIGGGERLVLDLCRYGPERQKVVSPVRGRMQAVFERHGIEVQVGETPAELAGYLADADVVNVHWPQFLSHLFQAVLAAGKPMLCTLHWLSVLPPLPGLVICVSKGVYDLQEPNRERRVWIPNGIDTSRFPAARRDASEARILRVCRPEKCAEYFWPALFQVLSTCPEATLTVVGGPAYECGRVRSVGDRLEVERFFAEADLFAYTPRPGQGAMDLVVMEAMASGLPCVLSDVPCVNEVVEHEVTGLLTPFGDVTAFTAGLERLVRDRELRHALGARAAAAAREQFDLRDRISFYSAAYERAFHEALLPAELPRWRALADPGQARDGPTVAAASR